MFKRQTSARSCARSIGSARRARERARSSRAARTRARRRRRAVCRSDPFRPSSIHVNRRARKARHFFAALRALHPKVIAPSTRRRRPASRRSCTPRRATPETRPRRCSRRRCAMRPSGVRFTYSATNSGAWPASCTPPGTSVLTRTPNGARVLREPAREIQHARLGDAVADRLVALGAAAAPIVVDRLIGRDDAVGRGDVDDAAGASRARARVNCAMKDCDTTNALLRCDSIIASQADSGYCSNGPVSSAASAGDDPSPALLTRIVGAPKRSKASRIASCTASRRPGRPCEIDDAAGPRRSSALTIALRRSAQIEDGDRGAGGR